MPKNDEAARLAERFREEITTGEGISIQDLADVAGCSNYLARQVKKAAREMFGPLPTDKFARKDRPGGTTPAPEPAAPTLDDGAARRMLQRVGLEVAPYDVSDVPEEDEPIESLLSRRMAAYERAQRRSEMQAPRTIRFADDMPIALANFGDPHLDDDGCALKDLCHDLDVVESTEGMHAGHLGDATNSWIGKLMRLWAHQSSTHGDEVRIAQWFFGRCRWLYSVNGNHDDWHPDAFRYMTKDAQIDVNATTDAMLHLVWPGGASLKVHARHTFKGTSIYNPLHGSKRESLWNPWADVYISGHHHEAAHASEERRDGRPVWFVKAAGYKDFDSYARRLQFGDNRLGRCMTLVIDPGRPPGDQVVPYRSVDEAAEVLTWLRKRRAA